MVKGLSRPLNGVRVVELASFVSGPFATMMLADLGADVVKVEPPNGDALRRFGRSGADMSPLFVNTNRGKRSVVFDLKDPHEIGLLHDLLADADVLVCNWRPGVAARMGIDDDEIATRNPRLIRVYVTGFGADGPLSDAPAFDSVIQARLGWGEAQGDGTSPALAPSYVVDKVAAAMVCQAALVALFARERLGIADRVDLSLLDAASYVNFPDVLANRTLIDHQPVGARNRQAAAARFIEAADGWMVVVPVTAHQVRRSCAAIGRPGLADELLAERDATALTSRLLDELERATRTGTVDHWVTVFTDADVPAGPCLDLDGHLADGQVEHSQLYDVSEWGSLGSVRHIRYPAVFASWGRLVAIGGPPRIGEHSEEVRDQIATAARQGTGGLR